MPMSAAELADLDRQHLWHPFTQQQSWSEEDFPIIERADDTTLYDTDGQRLHRRRLLAVVQRPRPPPPGASTSRSGTSSTASRTRRCSASPTRRRPSWPSAWSTSRPTGCSRVFFSDNGLDRVRDRAEDGLPVPPPARRVVALGLRLPARQLPRRHARLGLGGRDRALPLALPPAALRRRGRREPGDADAPACAAGRARRPLRRGHRRAARAGRGGHPRRTPTATCARCASCATSSASSSSATRSPPASGARARCSPASTRASRPTSCASPRGSPAATCRWRRR